MADHLADRKDRQDGRQETRPSNGEDDVVVADDHQDIPRAPIRGPAADPPRVEEQEAHELQRQDDEVDQADEGQVEAISESAGREG